jgi:protein-tyrosine phosphatase
MDDFAHHDLVIAMDSENLDDLKRKCPAEHRHKLRLFLPDYAPQLNLSDTPDPYYVGALPMYLWRVHVERGSDCMP